MVSLDTAVDNGFRSGADISRSIDSQFRMRKQVLYELFDRMVRDHEPFYGTVYPMYMARDLTNSDVLEIIGWGLYMADGVYTRVAALFNIPPKDYKKFLNFLRKHDLQLPFSQYRPHLTAQATTK